MLVSDWLLRNPVCSLSSFFALPTNTLFVPCKVTQLSRERPIVSSEQTHCLSASPSHHCGVFPSPFGLLPASTARDSTSRSFSFPALPFAYFVANGTRTPTLLLQSRQARPFSRHPVHVFVRPYVVGFARALYRVYSPPHGDFTLNLRVIYFFINFFIFYSANF